MGRILMIEFNDGDSSVFDEIMRALEQHSNFEHFRLRNESMLSLPGLEIFIRRRKAYSGYTEILLTTKECILLRCHGAKEYIHVKHESRIIILLTQAGSPAAYSGAAGFAGAARSANHFCTVSRLTLTARAILSAGIPMSWSS